ncbi:MAG: DNA-directed RNA polymerase subunit beta, partial [Planctomycetota bacterium]|nr:DNA-directed RNA polymerase subunit beta [Planctomycetota bacterium]
DRFRTNRKFRHGVSDDEMRLMPQDMVEVLKYLVKLRAREGEIDDIDHLGNRQVRSLCELACEEIRKGFLKLKRTAQERMSIRQKEQLTPHLIVNSKTVSSAIEYFFARSELSQVVDQTNPLSQLTHERRLSALGPGGLSRKRAGFAVRDVHPSHYGRICPIETPEGTNIGLISSLALYATIDDFGFLVTPYQKVEKGRVTGEVVYLRADEEEGKVFAPADTPVNEEGKILGETVLGRVNGEFKNVPPQKVEYMDVSPRQLVGVSANLIPFLEHDDASRALMGSNMQRQAVPALQTEKALVVTGVEEVLPRYSGMVVVAEEDGIVTYVDSQMIKTKSRKTEREYRLRKFEALNEKTCLNQKPIVKMGDSVKKGQVIADGAATKDGELALGKNVLVAFLPWDGYNFEDAIVVSERLVREDVFKSIHLHEFEVEVRETKLGREEFTREIPNVPEKMLANLDENGIVKIGTKVNAGDILVGKIVPKSKTELTPEEKLLRAIFGKAGEDVKNDSLEVPSGVEGIVVDTRKFSRKFHLSKEEQDASKKELKELRQKYKRLVQEELDNLFGEVEELTGKQLSVQKRKDIFDLSGIERLDVKNIREAFDADALGLVGSQANTFGKLRDQYLDKIEFYLDELEREESRVTRGDELPAGVLERVTVTIATMRNLSVGDKLAGRHGNKGVVSKILPIEDMPFLEDGTPIDILLNPLSVPSRMNVGQILETHLGWACQKLGIQAVTPIFDGYTEEDVRQMLKEAGLPEDGQVTLYDGRTGEPFAQKATVGFMYIMKLHHLVDDKIHARATGPYSLITQQPLGGKARFGGQRFGEMEVWALESYGASNVLQEILTVKSDDVDGRNRIYEAMIKGENWLEPGTPVSFEVLINELKGLCLNIDLKKSKPEEELQF